SEGGRTALHYRGAADAELMSAPAGPGRTWPSFIAERRMPVLAGAFAAAVLRGGDRIARLSGVGGAPASAFFAYLGNQDDCRGQPECECAGHRDMDHTVAAVSIEH